MGVGPAEEEEQEAAGGEGQGRERQRFASSFRAYRGGPGLGELAASKSHSSTGRGGAGRGLTVCVVAAGVLRAVLRCIYVP